MENLSNHELAQRFLNKQRILGKDIIDIKLLPDDRVMLIEVYDKESTGTFTIPSFITEFMQIRSGSGRFVKYPLFDQCRFSEIIFDNDKYISLDAYRLFSNMRSKTLKVRFKHPECISNAARMFEGCEELVKLDIGGFNTENVTSMQNMFNECKSLEELDLRDFNTHRVTDMSKMFCRCFKLRHLDISSFSTENVKTMFAMFYFCTDIDKLDLGGFDTSGVSNADSMFSGCTSIKSLDLSNFNLNNIKTAKYMFRDCKNLEHLEIGEFNPYASLDSITFGCDKLDTRI